MNRKDLFDRMSNARTGESLRESAPVESPRIRRTGEVNESSLVEYKGDKYEMMCKDCGWKGTVEDKTGWGHIQHCPKCDKLELQIVKESVVESALGDIKSTLMKVLYGAKDGHHQDAEMDRLVKSLLPWSNKGYHSKATYDEMVAAIGQKNWGKAIQALAQLPTSVHIDGHPFGESNKHDDLDQADAVEPGLDESEEYGLSKEHLGFLKSAAKVMSPNGAITWQSLACRPQDPTVKQLMKAYDDGKTPEYAVQGLPVCESLEEMSDQLRRERIAKLGAEIQAKKTKGEDWSAEKDELTTLRKELANESTVNEDYETEKKTVSRVKFKKVGNQFLSTPINRWGDEVRSAGSVPTSPSLSGAQAAAKQKWPSAEVGKYYESTVTEMKLKKAMHAEIQGDRLTGLGTKMAQLPSGTQVRDVGVDMNDPIAGEPVVIMQALVDGQWKLVKAWGLPILMGGWKKELFTEASGEKDPFKCEECGAKFKRKIGPNTVEVKCPKCGSYDTLPTEYFGEAEDEDLDEKGLPKGAYWKSQGKTPWGESPQGKAVDKGVSAAMKAAKGMKKSQAKKDATRDKNLNKRLTQVRKGVAKNEASVNESSDGSGAEIWRQITASTKMACGARDVVVGDNPALCQFRVGGGRPFQKIVVKLEPTDTYRVEYWSGKDALSMMDGGPKEVKTGIYVDMLSDVIYRMVNQ